jgi:hypothetical protein
LGHLTCSTGLKDTFRINRGMVFDFYGLDNKFKSKFLREKKK